MIQFVLGLAIGFFFGGFFAYLVSIWLMYKLVNDEDVAAATGRPFIR